MKSALLVVGGVVLGALLTMIVTAWRIWRDRDEPDADSDFEIDETMEDEL